MEELIKDFRVALDRIDWEQMPVGFKSFPRGACGDISEILAEYLYSNGFCEVEYVSGENERGSHAWLEINGLAVDIAADQFEEVSESVLIQSPEIWHSQFNDISRRKAGYKGWTGPAISRIMRVHREILGKLNALRSG